MTKEGLRHHAEDVLRQAESVRQQAKDALALDGSPEAQAVYAEVAGWSPTRRQACLDHAKLLEATSRTGSRAGVAAFLTKPLAQIIFSHSHGVMVGDADAVTILQVESDVALAETAAQEAGAEAQKVADAHAATQAAEQAKIQAEVDATTAVTSTCASNWPACKTKCDGGDVASCEVFGMYQWNARPPNIPVARSALAKACNSGSMPTACLNVRKLDADVQVQAAQIQSDQQHASEDADAWWGQVVGSADQIATTNYASNFAQRVSPTPQNQRAAIRARVAVQNIGRNQYCPGKKEFIRRTSPAEFQRRASNHCATNAPTAAGSGGTSVTLTTVRHDGAEGRPKWSTKTQPCCTRDEGRPLGSVGRHRLQTTTSCSGKEPGWCASMEKARR
jgi:hypothetical protein